MLKFVETLNRTATENYSLKPTSENLRKIWRNDSTLFCEPIHLSMFLFGEKIGRNRKKITAKIRLNSFS